MILTPRLACIAALVPQGAQLADIGTDHGKLPITLLIEGRIAHAIGSDLREGPLDHAARNAEEHGRHPAAAARCRSGWHFSRRM